MARSQSPRPLRVIVRTVLATPMVIALLAAGGVTAVLAYFALPSSRIDDQRTIFEGTEFAAPTTISLAGDHTPTATIRPTLEPFVLEEDEDPTATPERDRRAPATRTRAPAQSDSEADDTRNTPTPRSTPRSGTVAFLRRTEPTVVAAAPVTTRQSSAAPEPVATLPPVQPSPNPAVARSATATLLPSVPFEPTINAITGPAGDHSAPAIARAAHSARGAPDFAAATTRNRHPGTNTHAHSNRDATSTGPDTNAIPADLNAHRTGDPNHGPDQYTGGDRNPAPDTHASRDGDPGGHRHPKCGADRNRGSHPDRSRPAARWREPGRRTRPRRHGGDRLVTLAKVTATRDLAIPTASW